MSNNFFEYETAGTSALQPSLRKEEEAIIIDFEEAKRLSKRDELKDKLKFESYVVQNELKQLIKWFVRKSQFIRDVVTGSLAGTQVRQISNKDLIRAGLTYCAYAILLLALTMIIPGM